MDYASWPIAEKRGVCAAGIVFLAGLLLASAKVGDSVAIIALLLLPFLAYGIVSGKIQEFTGPGGWGAKFKEAASEKVKPAELTDWIQNIQIFEKGGVQALRAAGQKLEKGNPIALTLRLGQQNYNDYALRQYVEKLQIADREMSVLFLDANGRLVVTAEGATVLGLLRNQDHEQSDRLIQAIKDSDTAYLRSLPGFQWEAITKERSNAEALQMMREANARTMVVVDSEKRPIGVVKRDDIVARLLVELAGSHPSHH